MRVFIFILIVFVIALANGYKSDYKTNHRISKARTEIRAFQSKSEQFKPKISPYIAGGVVSDPHKYPYLVAVYIDQRFLCGGALINPEWVLTAGHCTASAGSSIIAEMGAYNISANEDTQVADETYVYITHEDFNFETLANDIGLIKLPATVIYSNAIRNISLPFINDPDLEEGVPVNMTGWGAVGGGVSDIPYEETVTTISNSDCTDVYGAPITDGSLCTSGEFGRGACKADEGGPVVYESINGVKLRGIISIGGCDSGKPSVHTRVTHYLDWIRDNTGIS